MIDDGVKENGRDDVVVQDIAMHLLDAIEGAERTGATSSYPVGHQGTELHHPGAEPTEPAPAET
jgi:hypothetical protein